MTLERRQLLDLALEARKKYLSPHTGFIHLCYEGAPHDTIPLYENFCACLALFRTRQSDAIADAKTLLRRLLAFHVDGRFPLYLHNYPHCPSTLKSYTPLIPLYWIDRDYGHLIDYPLKPYLAGLNELFAMPVDKESLQGLTLLCMRLQMEELSADEARKRCELLAAHWHPTLHRRIGDLKEEKRSAESPLTTLFDLYMSQYLGELATWSSVIQPVHLQAALVFPYAVEPEPKTLSTEPLLQKQEGAFEISWGDRRFNYSLASFHPGWGQDFICTLGEDLPEDRSGSLELTLFMTRGPGVDILVEGKKATAFRISDRVTIKTPQLSLILHFEVLGNGQFMGHISRGNRPNQTEKDLFKAYDWQISLRTLARDERCRVRLHVEISSHSS